MQYVVTAKEMKLYDSYTIEKIGLPALLLMERAAMEVVLAVSERCHKKTKVLVFAGCGNNGGDGLAVGRLLSEKGAEVTFYMPKDTKKVSRETKEQMKLLSNLGFSIQRNLPKGEYDIVIDALFGIGLSREVIGVYREAIDKINRLGSMGAYVVAVDIPSGICADTGRVLGCGVYADLTVTFSYRKAGQLFYPGREHTGKLLVREIGIAKAALKEFPPSYSAFDEKEMGALLPKRDKAGNKGSFGKVLLVAGSREAGGAAILCAESILKTGAGMVKVITHEKNRDAFLKRLPEAMLSTYEKMPNSEELARCLSWADVIVAGPGLCSFDTESKENAALLLKELLKQGKKPFVIDADGLNLLAERKALKKLVKEYEKNRIILTPHPGELVRLKEITMEEYKSSPVKAVKELAKQLCCIVVGKDAVTLAVSPKEETVFINRFGNDGMATAGSGDVLAGIIGGFLAQMKDSFGAACAGVTLHAMAGDRAASVKSRYGMTASDIIEKAGAVLSEQER